MSYAMTRPAISPDGHYYEVAASPRGDLLIWQSETGLWSWMSATIGALGIVSFLINLLVFKRRWRVVVRPARSHRAESPSSGVLVRRDVPKRLVDNTMSELAADIEAGRLAVAA